MAPHQLTPQDARRIAVRAQLLASGRPTDLLETIRHLTLVQDDPTAAVAPSAELVLWSRLGSAYVLGDVRDAVTEGRLVEMSMMLRPAEDVALFTAEMAAWPGLPPLSDWELALEHWVEANDDCRRDILDKLYDEGPLPSSELPDLTLVPWRSSGWNDDRNVRMLLEVMVARGEVASAGREGRVRLWDLAERVYPELPPVPLDDALRIRRERRLRGLGIARAKATVMPGEPNHVGDAGEEAVVEGVRGTWRVDPAYLDQAFVGRTALLSPLDRLVMDRKRMAEVFDFDYQLEMYKPAAKRRFGYWAMPVLVGDRLVGKLDATSERDRGVLRVDALHEDEPWDPSVRDDVWAEVEALADFLDLVVEDARG